jgi:hypothetical protein
MRLRVLVIGALLSMLAATSAAPAQPLSPSAQLSPVGSATSR